jgi:two-component system, sensor histidine kinase and response regulator
VPVRTNYFWPITRQAGEAIFRVNDVGVIGRGKDLQILLAEDNAVNQRLVIRLLEKQGHRVVAVNNGLEALLALTAQQFDLVLMDIQMPEMDGLEATARIREQEHATGTRIPIVAVTANALKGDCERYLAAGMDGYVPKPIQPAELFKVIAEAAPVAMNRAVL